MSDLITPWSTSDTLDPSVIAALQCPPWCELPADHHENLPGSVVRIHERVIGATPADPAAPAGALVTVVVRRGVFFDDDNTGLTIEPATVQLDGVPPAPGGLPASAAIAVAELVACAARVLAGESR